MSSFITVDKVLSLTQASLNTDPCLIETEIEIAAKRYFKYCLGKELFNELCTQIDDLTVTAENQLLLDAIEPSLARFVLFKALPLMRNNIGSNGILLNDTQFGSQSTLEDLTYIRQNILKKAEFLRDCVIEFLEDNIDDYPLYDLKCESTCGKTKKSKIIFY